MDLKTATNVLGHTGRGQLKRCLWDNVAMDAEGLLLKVSFDCTTCQATQEYKVRSQPKLACTECGVDCAGCWRGPVDYPPDPRPKTFGTHGQGFDGLPEQVPQLPKPLGTHWEAEYSARVNRALGIFLPSLALEKLVYAETSCLWSKVDISYADGELTQALQLVCPQCQQTVEYPTYGLMMACPVCENHCASCGLAWCSKHGCCSSWCQTVRSPGHPVSFLCQDSTASTCDYSPLNKTGHHYRSLTRDGHTAPKAL